MAKIKLSNIKEKTDEIEHIKTATDRIANIENKVGEMAKKIEALETLVGKSDEQNHANDTGIYKTIYDSFTDLMG